MTEYIDRMQEPDDVFEREVLAKFDPAPSPLVALLDQLDELRANATPGPWTPATAPAESSDETHAEYLTNALRPEQGRPLWVAWAALDEPEDDAEYVVPLITGDGPTSEANARYIAAVHDALPELIAELRKRDAAVRAVLELADELKRVAGDDDGVSAVSLRHAASLIHDALSVTP